MALPCRPVGSAVEDRYEDVVLEAGEAPVELLVHGGRHGHRRRAQIRAQHGEGRGEIHAASRPSAKRSPPFASRNLTMSAAGRWGGTSRPSAWYCRNVVPHGNSSSDFERVATCISVSTTPGW